MKRIVYTLLLLLLLTVPMFGQCWFQTSIEHKFNSPAGLSISNEVGYGWSYGSFALQPSIDYTYSCGSDQITQTQLYKQITVVGMAKTASIIPYVSISLGHLTVWPVVDGVFGGSVQIGCSVPITDKLQYFAQYRYYRYTPLDEGQQSQFGMMYTF
jgi:hypothetical protein